MSWLIIAVEWILGVAKVAISSISLPYNLTSLNRYSYDQTRTVADLTSVSVADVTRLRDAASKDLNSGDPSCGQLICRSQLAS